MVIAEVAAAADEKVNAAGEKDGVAPLGSPLADSDTVPVKPPVGVTVMVKPADWPRVKQGLAGEISRARPGLLGWAATAAVTAPLTAASPRTPRRSLLTVLDPMRSP